MKRFNFGFKNGHLSTLPTGSPDTIFSAKITITHQNPKRLLSLTDAADFLADNLLGEGRFTSDQVLAEAKEQQGEWKIPTYTLHTLIPAFEWEVIEK